MRSNKSLATLAACCWVLFSHLAFGDVRKESFGKTKLTRQFVAFGGNYKSDQNSEEYDISLGYKYRSEKFIHEIEFLNRVDYVEYNQGPSGSKQKVTIKNKELYDGEISSKMMLANSKNYLNYYNRSKYDKYSNYNYDITNVAGLGRRFYDDKLEMDLNAGYNNVGKFGSGFVINPTIRVRFNISKKISVVSKGFLFLRDKTYNDELKSRISYLMDNKVSLEFIHGYEKNRYHNSTKKETINNINRSFIIRIKYDF